MHLSNSHPTIPGRTRVSVSHVFSANARDEKLTRLTFFYQPIFSSPQLIQFIDRIPKLKAHDQARVFFGPNSESSSWVTLPQTSGGKLRLEIIKCRLSDQLSSLTQLCSSSIPRALISAVDRLYIAEGDSNYLCFEEDIEYSPVQWLELLHPFVAVKYLYISYRPCSARTCWGESDRSVTHFTDFFLRGDPPTGTCPGSRRAVCCRTTAYRSVRSLILLEWHKPHKGHLGWRKGRLG